MRYSGRFYFGGIICGWYYDLDIISHLFFPASEIKGNLD